MTYVSVPNSLMAKHINAYSRENQLAKEAFHRDGVKFLRKLAASLGLQKGEFDVRSNAGGMAVSGEVTLHCDDLYVQLYESCLKPGVAVLYRSCDSRSDYCGHQNHSAEITRFRGEEAQRGMRQSLTLLLTRERSRKAALLEQATA